MNPLLLFTDGSVDVRSKIGYGSYLAVSDSSVSLDVLRNCVRVRRFEDTSSSKLELQTLLWALGEIQELKRKVIVHTDSQNVIGLPGRRDRLEKNDYRSKNGRRLNHFELYQEFFRAIDRMNCEFVKVRGHKVSARKGEIDHFFTIVDRASRKALREEAR